MYIHKIAAGNVAEVPRKPHTIGFPAKLWNQLCNKVMPLIKNSHCYVASKRPLVKLSTWAMSAFFDPFELLGTSCVIPTDNETSRKYVACRKISTDLSYLFYDFFSCLIRDIRFQSSISSKLRSMLKMSRLHRNCHQIDGGNLETHQR